MKNKPKAEIGANELALDVADLAAWDKALAESGGRVDMPGAGMRVQVLCTASDLEHAATASRLLRAADRLCARRKTGNPLLVSLTSHPASAASRAPTFTPFAKK